MATFTVQDLQTVGNVHGDVLPTFHGAEAATQSWTKGDVLIQSSGRIAIGTSAVASVNILGTALDAATGTTDTDVPYTPWLPGTIVKANLTTVAGTYTSLIGDLLTGFSVGLQGTYFIINEDVRFSDTDKGDQMVFVPFAWARGPVSGVETQAAVGDIDPPVLAVVVGSIWTQGLTTETA